MQIPQFTYKTYQDVRHNLTIWTTFVLTAILSIIFFIVLSPTQKAPIVKIIFPKPDTYSIQVIFAVVAAILVGCGGISWFLIEIIKIHDHIYDRLIIKWREEYDLHFLLPRLIEPIKEKISPKILEYAKDNRDKFMVPFYDLIGDGKVGIKDNTRVRFYEQITIYWMTQVNEIFLLLCLIGLPIYILANDNINFSNHKFAWLVLGIEILLIVNRVWRQSVLIRVEKRTIEQLNEIFSKPDNLDKLIKDFTTLSIETKKKGQNG